MDIIEEFLKASLKERSDLSIAYNSNLSYYERLAIILAKNLNGKILKKDKYCYSVSFNLSQDYSFQVYYSSSSFSGHVYSGNRELFYWKNLYYFRDENQEELSKEARECEERYKVPLEVMTEVFNLIVKVVSISDIYSSQKLPDHQPKDYRKSTKARRNLELYKKDQAYYRDLFVKSGAIPEEDLARYIISIKPEECEEPDWDIDYSDGGGSATVDSKIAFIFRDRITKALYKLIYNVRFTASAGGWYSSGSYWEPPDGEAWFTGYVDDDVEAEFDDFKTDEPVNEELEEHLIDLIDDFSSTSMLSKYVEDNLEDITGYDVK